MKFHRPSESSSHRRATGGFTLIELLVAAAITAAMAGFIFVIIRNVSTTWSRASGRLGADAQARLALEQITLDLQGAHFRDDGNIWQAADILDTTGNAPGLWQAAVRHPKPTGGLSLELTAPALSDARFGHAGVFLRFFTTSRGGNTAATSPTISEPVAVGYQIVRRFTSVNPANQNTAYLLHRAEARPATENDRAGVLEAGYSITSASYTTEITGTNNGAVTGDLRSIQVPGSNTGVRHLDSVLAENVIDFGVRCYVHDSMAPGGLRLVFPAVNARGDPSAVASASLRSSLPGDTPANEENFNRVFPDVVDVMLRVLTDDGAALIATIERGEGAAVAIPANYGGDAHRWWWGVALENSRVYTRRILLRTELP